LFCGELFCGEVDEAPIDGLSTLTFVSGIDEEGAASAEAMFSSAFVGRPIECVSSLEVALGFSWPHAATNNVAPTIKPFAQYFTS
jgi:hypothetical protein